MLAFWVGSDVSSGTGLRKKRHEKILLRPEPPATLSSPVLHAVPAGLNVVSTPPGG